MSCLFSDFSYDINFVVNAYSCNINYPIFFYSSLAHTPTLTRIKQKVDCYMIIRDVSNTTPLKSLNEFFSSYCCCTSYVVTISVN